MALAHLLSRGQAGLTAYEVSVEVHIAGGLPSFSIAGLPTTTVRESKDRVRAALQTCGLPIPPRRITVHLGPAEIPKDGGRFDLPIALGVLLAQQSRPWNVANTEFVGELTLGGELRAVRGILPAIIAAKAAGRTIVIPAQSSREAALVEHNTALTAAHLTDVIGHLDGRAALAGVPAAAPGGCAAESPDLSDIQGQDLAKRALTLAAAGGHNLLFVGPPGAGKSMLAERLSGLLPPLTNEQRLQVAAIRSLTGQVDDFSGAVPFRAPHHTCSARALIGGGAKPRPGEVSMANQGILFLDELPEFARDAVEALREPLESGFVTVSRVMDRVRYPAEFLLVAAMNPCPCGYAGDEERCICTPARLLHYQNRVSGPILDRIDMHVEVPRVAVKTALEQPALESPVLRQAVAAARQRQLDRAGTLNARLKPAMLQQVVAPTKAAAALLSRCSEKWQLSGRAVVRILKTARTIADLAAAESVERQHIAEALQLRYLDRRGRQSSDQTGL